MINPQDLAVDSTFVFGIIKDLDSDSSKQHKVETLKNFSHLPLLQAVLEAAYDPGISYYVAEKSLEKVFAQVTPKSNGQFGPEVWTLLQDLSSRRLTGESALASIGIVASLLNKPSGELLKRILLKDLRCGIGDSTINKAIPGLIPVYPYMRCSLPASSNINKWDWSKGAISQEKADGMFANVDLNDDGSVVIRSRQGSVFPAEQMVWLHDAVRQTLDRNTQTHGELVVFDMNSSSQKPLPREVGNGILNSILSGGELLPNHQVVMMAWDQIPLDEAKPKGKYKVGYAARLTSLVRQVSDIKTLSGSIRIIPTKLVKSRAEAFAHYKELLAAGKEGTVVKSPEAIWADGTSKDQVKFKLEVSVELEVKDFEAGTIGSKYESTLGALVCTSACGKLVVNVNGRGDAMRDEVWNNKLDWLGAIVTVKANAIMAPSEEGKPHSLFLPVFMERRLDKTEADSLEEIQAQFEAAVQG